MRRRACAASGRCGPSLGLDPAAHESADQCVRDDRDAHGAVRHSTRSAPSPDWPASTSGPPTSRSRWDTPRSQALDRADGPRRHGAHPGHRVGGRAGYRHPCRGGQARKGHGRVGLPDDHPHIGVCRRCGAARPSISRRRSDVGGPGRSGDRRGPRAGRGDREATALRRLSGRRMRSCGSTSCKADRGTPWRRRRSPFELDVTSAEQWACRGDATVVDRFGSLTTLINNAGVLHRASLADETPDGLREAVGGSTVSDRSWESRRRSSNCGGPRAPRS